MTKVNGSAVLFYAETAPGVWTAWGSATGHTMNINVAFGDTTNKGSSGWTGNMYTLKGVTMDLEALTDHADTLTEEELFALITGRTSTMLRFQGQNLPIFYEIEGQVSNYSPDYSNETPGSYSASFKATGPLQQLIMPESAYTNAGGTTITLDCGMLMASPVGKHALFTATIAGAPRAITAAAAGGTADLIVLTIDGAAITNGQVVTLAYTSALTTIEGATYGTLTDFTAMAVTNNVP